MSNNNEPFFQRLTRLFRSGPAIQRRVKGIDPKNFYGSQLIRGNSGYRTTAPYGFGKDNSSLGVLGAYGILDRLSRYAEYAEMDVSTPEIATALDIYCLAGDVKIPLLSGDTTEIQELYNNKKENFYVYSFDLENNKFVPGLCKKVLKTGINQKIHKICFDDNSYLRLTENHLVLMSDGTYKRVKELTPNDSVRGLYRKLSEPTAINKLKNYELILQPNGNWQYTHRMVTDCFYPNKKGVCHHVNCTKHDNSPENLELLSYKEHQNKHRTLNALRWKNDAEYSKKMSGIFSEHAKKMHSTPNWTQDVFLKRRNEVFATYDTETRKYKFGRSGKINGMYQQGYKLIGPKNGRYKQELNHDFDENVLSELIEKNIKFDKACEILHTNSLILRKNLKKYNLKWSKKYITGCYKTHEELIEEFKNYVLNSNSKNIVRDYKKACIKNSISLTQAYRILSKFGYKNWSDFVSKINHKIISITEDGIEDVYDLQVEKYHNFAAGINNGYTIIHNSDECVGGDDRGRSFHVYSENQAIKNSLDELFYDVLNVEFNLKPWTRNLVKYGDFLLFNEVLPDIGVINVFPIPVNEIEREDGFDPEDPYATRFKWITRGNKYLENWQISHFRLVSNDLFIPYGTSILESARRSWRTLLMLEDAMLTYRVVRSPERRVFYIDVGNIAPNDVESYMEAVKSTMRNQGSMDRRSGREDLRYNAQPIAWNSIIPLLDGRNITIKQLAEEHDLGKENWVHSISDKTTELLPGKVIWCGKNYTANKMVKVTLDDGSTIKTAPEHPFILRDNSSVRADELKPNDSLMPFYRQYNTINGNIPVNLENKKGYPKVYDPKTGKYKFTHKMVANNVLQKEKNLIEETLKNNPKNKFSVVHHENFNKHDASPNNLRWIGDSDHTMLHYKLSPNGFNKLMEYVKSAENKKRVIENNIKLGLGKKLAANYNGTELHKQHNEIRRQAQYNSWSDVEQIEKRSAKMRFVFPTECLLILKEVIKENPKAGRRKIHSILMNNNKFISLFKEANKHSKRRIEKFSTTGVKKVLIERFGYEKGLNSVREEIFGKDYCKLNPKFKPTKEPKLYQKRPRRTKLENHKVISVELLDEICDVYCMTVVGPNGENDRHNFAIMTNDNIELSKNYKQGGVIVKNSILDDYWVPVRGNAQGTKIETLSGGQHVSATEDVEYMQKKLFSALKVPKPYLNFDENLSAKASLAQMDIRFSRTINSIQKIMISELNKLAMIHLFVKGFDGADLINFDLKLSNPSSVALLQKLELWSVKFDTAGTALETKLVDQRWIQKNILELTPGDIDDIEGGLRKDKVREKELDDLELMPVDKRLSSKTTDIFDASNYNSPSPVVPKETNKDNENNSGREITLSNYREYDEAGNSYVTDLDIDTKKAPIKATPFLSRHRKNRVRRVGEGGISNLQTPDVAAMLSPKNKYNKDVYGLKHEAITVKIRSLKELNVIEDSKTSDNQIVMEPIFGNELKCIMGKLKKHISEHPKTKAKLLKEQEESEKLSDINLSDDELNDSKLSVEKISNKLLLEIIDNKSKIEIIDEVETIKEKTLSDVFNGTDDDD